jgi:hypothetical protein
VAGEGIGEIYKWGLDMPDPPRPVSVDEHALMAVRQIARETITLMEKTDD